MFNHSTTHAIAALGAALMLATVPATSATRTFFDDDPVTREPETQDASAAQGRDINLLFDLAMNLFTQQGDSAGDVRARNINTIDEVPDSNWFTNRLLARTVSPEEAAHGPLQAGGPVPGALTIIAPKRSGDAPGFTARDANNTLWFVSFDGRGYPEAATGAILVANKIFWTLGYWQIENYLTSVRPEALTIAESANIRPPSGHRRKMTRDDLEAILRRAHRSADGSYRAVAARAVEGRPIEGFQYFGTRSDDPNDVVPHEHRRELRALKVFGAWTNLVDMKAGNTLDTVVNENGRAVVRHYLQDVGSTFGTGANGPHDFFEGWEYLQENDLTMKRLVSFGFLLKPWQTVDYRYFDAIGRFEGDAFDPTQWKPRVPTAAFLHARADDNFWAARRVMAFSDDMIRAVVATGQYSDAAAAEHLTRTLIKRRDAIGRAYLTSINPIIDPVLDDRGLLSFHNAAVDAGLAQHPASYLARWFTFDNAAGESRSVGESSGSAAGMQAPTALPSMQEGFIKIELSGSDASAHASWQKPVAVYFRRQRGGSWRLVGLDRLPGQGTAPAPSH
jgi:hypothetical protein